MDDLSIPELRKEVDKLRRNAVRKNRRLASKGMGNVAPIRVANIHSRYTRRQLEVYAQQLREFNSRKTQFVRLKDGTTVNKAVYDVYLSRVNEANKRITAHWKKFADVKDYKGSTSRQRKQIMGKGEWSAHLQNVNSGVNFHIPLRPDQIQSKTALNKLTKNVKDWGTAENIRSRLFKQYEQIKAMTFQSNLDIIDKELKRLTPEQIDYLFNNTTFIDNISNLYMRATGQFDKNKDDAFLSEVLAEDSGIEIFKQLDDARRLFPNETTDSKPSRRPRNLGKRR